MTPYGEVRLNMNTRLDLTPRPDTTGRSDA